MLTSRRRWSIVLFVFHYSEVITAKILKLDAFRRRRLRTIRRGLQLCKKHASVLLREALGGVGQLHLGLSTGAQGVHLLCSPPWAYMELSWHLGAFLP